MLFVVAAHSAWAQLDSSSAVLLRSTGKGPATKQNLDSSRYKIRAPESRKDDDEIGEKPGTMIPTPVYGKSTTVKTEATAKAKDGKASATSTSTSTSTTTLQVTPEPPQPKDTVPAPVPTYEGDPGVTVIKKSDAAPATGTEAANDPAAETKRPPVADQVRELLLGGTPEEIQEAQKAIHPQDPRANVLQISIAPAYFYDASSSEYSFRRYTTNGPGFGLGANLWFTPFFGLQSRYFASVGASVRSGGTNMVPMDVQTFEAGIRFRKHFGYSRKAPQLIWGLDYVDMMDKIGKEATTVTGRKSSGVSLSLGAVVPTSNVYSHTFQVDIRPRMNHGELNTGVDVKSGGKSETNALSLSVGGDWTLDRRNQIFWKTQYSVERNLFKGAASQADPDDGITPDGVSVTNSLVIFYFGFKWGS
jgi:hypothetical protein